MKQLLFSLALFILLTGCQDKQHDEQVQKEHDAKIAAQAKAEVLAEIAAKEKAQQAQQQNSKLNTIGIEVNNGTITIDTNKTKDFLQQLSQKMEQQMQKISNDLEKGIVDAKEEGIQIDEQHIEIDLNKTRNIFENWSKKIQVFVNEFDAISNEKNKNINKE